MFYSAKGKQRCLFWGLVGIVGLFVFKTSSLSRDQRSLSGSLGVSLPLHKYLIMITYEQLLREDFVAALTSNYYSIYYSYLDGNLKKPGARTQTMSPFFFWSPVWSLRQWGRVCPKICLDGGGAWKGNKYSRLRKSYQNCHLVLFLLRLWDGRQLKWSLGDQGSFQGTFGWVVWWLPASVSPLGEKALLKS